jgi:hypothetical protein
VPYLGVKPVYAFIPGGTERDEWDSSQPTFSSYLNLFQPRGANYPHHIDMFQPIFGTFRLAWPSPVANGKLSLGDVEATVAGTFDVDQSALANKVLHYVNVTRYGETGTYYILALFYQLW